MCAPTVPWDWLVIDVAYVMDMLGGAMVFRARGASVPTWMAFGALATFVGVILFASTYAAQASFAAASEGATAAQMVQGNC